MPSPEDTNVTLAVLATKMDHMLSEMVMFRECQERADERAAARDVRINAVESGQALGRQWQGAHEKRHDRENVVLKAWSVVSATVAATIAGVVAWVKG